MSKLSYGVGLNDADYPVTYTSEDGSRRKCLFYATWHSMLERCYSQKKHQQRPTYKKCTVCDEWLSFMAFRSWMVRQDWKGKQLDKDILANDAGVYSPDTCVFVEPWLNNLLLDSKAIRGDCPVGVSLHVSGKYRAQIKINGTPQHLGLFVTKHEAHVAYLKSKTEHVIAKMIDYPDQRVKEAVLRKVAA